MNVKDKEKYKSAFKKELDKFASKLENMFHLIMAIGL